MLPLRDLVSQPAVQGLRAIVDLRDGEWHDPKLPAHHSIFKVKTNTSPDLASIYWNGYSWTHETRAIPGRRPQVPAGLSVRRSARRGASTRPGPAGRALSDPTNEEAIQTFASVWDAIADTPAEAANLKLRSELMDQIAAIVAEQGWTQNEAATRCEVTQPRMNDLLRGRISGFSVDALVNIAAALRLRI